MDPNRSRVIRILSIFAAVLAVGSVVTYAAIVTFRHDAFSEFIGLRGGPAQLTARVLTTPVGETTGAWHYHPGYVYNVVTQGTITIEDGCGQVRQYPRGKPSKPPKAASIAPTTSEARMRSNTTCSSARKAGPSGSIFPITSTGAARQARSKNALTTVGSASTIRHRSTTRVHASRMSTTGSGSRCSFQKIRFNERYMRATLLCAAV